MVTTAADRALIDTNVLVYASLRRSAFHHEAVQALHTDIQKGVELWVSRQILREYIAVLTRPGMTTLPAPATTAASDVVAFQRMFQVADETSTVTRNLLSLIQSFPVAGKQVHDANPVATTHAYAADRSRAQYRCPCTRRNLSANVAHRRGTLTQSSHHDVPVSVPS